MSKIVFDIETLAYPLESFDEISQEYLTRFSDTQDKLEELKRNLNLHAVTAQIIAVAMINLESKNGRVFFQSETSERYTSDNGLIEFISGSEKDILENFWRHIAPFQQIITFNGRAFDCPFVLLRSAILGVKPTKNLMPNRYDVRHHCDLLDQLTFYSSTRRFSLDFYCKAFGIESPKSQGITGLDMKALFESKRYRDIAAYCLGDVYATADLYDRWLKYLSLE